MRPSDRSIRSSPVSCSSAVGRVATVCHVRSIVLAVWSANVVSVRPGPTSTRTRSSLPSIEGASASARRPSSNRTVDRSCALQYPGRADSAPAHAPVCVATYGTNGSDRLTVAHDPLELLQDRIHHRRVERVRGVEEARRDGTRARASRWTSSIAGVGPDNTLNPGAFTAARATRSSRRSATVLARRHDRQHAARRERRDEPSALGEESQRVVEGHDSRERRGHELADAVADHRGRPNSPGSPELRTARTPRRTAPAARGRCRAARRPRSRGDRRTGTARRAGRSPRSGRRISQQSSIVSRTTASVA